jgi:hypothetical protein
LEVIFDGVAVAEEVLVEEVLGVVAGGLEHADGEALVGVGVGLGVPGAGTAGFQMGVVQGFEPAAFGTGEAL